MDSATYAVEAEIEQNHWWFVARRKMLGRLIREIGVPKSARILDIGTSTGTNLRMLRDLGFDNFEGVDFSREAVEWCASKGLGHVTQGDACSLPFPDETFDFVLATDIIEHVDDDVRALEQIRRVLRPGCAAIVTVPAFASLWGLQDEVAQHKRRYRARQVQDRISKANLACTQSFYFNFLLFGPIWLARQVIRAAGIKLRSENELNSPSINWILTKIFELDIALAPFARIPFGVSYLAVVRRATSDAPTARKKGAS